MSLGPNHGKLVAAFFAAVLILAFVGALSYRGVLQQEADQQWVEHTHVVLEKLAVVRSELLHVESLDAAYGDSRDEAFLRAVSAAFAQMRADLQELRTLTVDNPAQQAALDRLQPLLAARQTAIESNSVSAARRDALQTHVSTSSDEPQAVLTAMDREEQRLLQERLRTAGSASLTMKRVIVFGSILALALFTAAALAVFREMRERTRTEEALGTAEERYHLLFNNNPLPVWVYDTQTLAFLDVNPSAVSHYGYSPQEFLAMTIRDIRPNEDVPAVVESVAKVGPSVEDHGVWRHRKKDGTIIDVEVTSHPLFYSGRSARVVVASDITARKRAEEAIRRSEERFRLMVSNVKDYAIFLLDAEGRVVSWNEGAERIKGYRAEEIIGQHFSRFYSPEEVQRGKPAAVLEEAARRGRFEEEGWHTRKDGSRFWANAIITALHDEVGRLRGFAKITRDITERKNAEEQILRRSAELDAANKELETFAYSVSHDLRAPLRSIDGFSQALLEDYAPQLDSTGKDYLQRVRAAAQRMAILIDDLLGLSRVTRAELHREPIDLTQLALDVGSELRSGQPARNVEFIVAPSLSAEGDSRLMRIVLENLLGNSWKFTSNLERPRVEFARSANNGRNVFFVRDNGAGFNQAYAQRLFGAFQRLHGMNEFPGSGIGLATVQRIIHRHGGKIWAEGAVNRGATFYFTL